VKLWASGITALAALALVGAITTKRPSLPRCDAVEVSDIVRSALVEAVGGRAIDLRSSDDSAGTVRDGHRQCFASFGTGSGVKPVKYSVSLIGPGSLQVLVEASLSN
jgi:hypothetical protein